MTMHRWLVGKSIRTPDLFFPIPISIHVVFEVVFGFASVFGVLIVFVVMLIPVSKDEVVPHSDLEQCLKSVLRT